MVLEFPNLPASDSPVAITVQAFDYSHCLVGAATKQVTIKGGVKTTADIVLSKSTASCAAAKGLWHLPDGWKGSGSNTKVIGNGGAVGVALPFGSRPEVLIERKRLVSDFALAIRGCGYDRFGLVIAAVRNHPDSVKQIASVIA